ncbi:MAG: uroporphyrinogen decarboxylase family protein [Planctomycetota bacterium]|jgi:uroporphyrinogen decarboxylase|nr:uroporphyrinogen decarboxylase family protein [Planctomycetota bacterium]
MVRGNSPGHLPAIWDFFPCHVRAVGGVANFLDYYFDVDTKLDAQLKLQELIPEALILPGVFPDLGVVVEASAFGGQILWFEDGAPFIGEVIHSPRDIDTLKPPKPGLAGLMPLQLTQRETMRKRLKEQGREMEHWAMSMGPAEVAGLLMGYQNYYVAMYDDPKRVTCLMSLVTEFIIDWLRKQEEAIGGAEIICIADHVCNQVTPAQLREFILPHMKAIFSSFPNAAKIYHNEGHHSEDHIDQVLAFGADLWHFGSDVHDLSDLYRKIEDRIVLFGGLNPLGAMRLGTPDQVREESRLAIDAARGRRILFSTGTGTTPETTLENLRAMVEAAVFN